jgi:tRNA U34 5-methylaminomethyl-2-thiouridine-forming methyltransferase MnmC
MWSEIADDPVVENSETGDGTVEECCVVLDENQMDTNQIDKYSEVNPVSLHYFAIKLCHFHQNDKNCQTEQAFKLNLSPVILEYSVISSLIQLIL